MLTLYYSPNACSLAPHIVLEEIGEEFSTERVTIAEGKHRTAAYLAINPHGRVPALQTDEGILTENPAILTYLAARYSEARLLPQDPWQLGRCLSLLAFLSSSVHIAFGQFWRPERFTDNPAIHDRIVDGGRASIRRYFLELEERMAATEAPGTSAWAVGGQFTVADPYLLVFYRWGQRLRDQIDFVIEDRCPAWTRHADRLLVRPSVERAMARERAPA